MPKHQPKQPLTERQETVLEFIKLYVGKYRRFPTWWEICHAFDFKSPNAAHCYLKALKQKGYVRERPTYLQRANRALELVP
jgi:repressor LexA